MKPIFVLMGIQELYPLIRENLFQLRIVYPYAEAIIYTWGAMPMETDDLPYTGVVHNAVFRDTISCLCDASRRFPQNELVFLDAWSFLFEPIDDLFSTSCDVILAISAPDQLNWGHGENVFIKNTFMILGAHPQTRETFLNTLQQNFSLENRGGLESVDFTKLFDLHTPQLLQEEAFATLVLNRLPIRVHVVPASYYNHAIAYDPATWTPQLIPFAKIYHLILASNDLSLLKGFLPILRDARLKPYEIGSEFPLCKHQGKRS